MFPDPKVGPIGACQRKASPPQPLLVLKELLTPATAAAAASWSSVRAELAFGVRAAAGPAEEHGETVHAAMRPLLRAGRCFGLLPVGGVGAASQQQLRFRMRSPLALWAAAVSAALAAVCAASTLHVVRALRAGPQGFMKGIGLATAGAVFYGCATASVLLFLRLAPRWPRLLRRWAAVEREQAPLLGWPRVRRRARLWTCTIFFLSYVEHLFSILVHVPKCLQQRSDGLPCDFLRLYVRRSHAFLFSSERAAAYSPWLGVAVVVASELGTFAWNFNDVFVVVVSGALAARLAALNRHFTGADTQALTAADWTHLRHAYAATSGLVKMVDNEICAIVFLSFFSNLYFICLQLLNGLSPKSTSALDYVYFFGSFAYLVGRTVALIMTAARIHDEGRVALPVLYQCPATSYCLEAQRLQSQLTSDELTLTGLHFFSITRSFLLAVAGAIVTYEVILLQFNMPASSAVCCTVATATASSTALSVDSA